MDDKPLNAGGAYNINWDEIDENSNPFGIKANTKSVTKPPKPAPPPRSPAKVTSNGDGLTPQQVQPPNAENDLPKPNTADSTHQSKVTQPPLESKVIERSVEPKAAELSAETKVVDPPTEPTVTDPPVAPAAPKSPNQPTTDESTTEKIDKPSAPSVSPSKARIAKPVERKPISARGANRQPNKNSAAARVPEQSDTDLDEFPRPSPHTGPSPEQLAKALESVALHSSRPDDPEQTVSTPTGEAPAGFSDFPTDAPPSETLPPPLTRIDSSTRPASPAHASVLLNRPNMDEESSKPNGVLSAEDEIIALRKERDQLKDTIADMQRCIVEYDRSLMMMKESQSQPQVNVSVADLISERDQAIEEVATIEKAFGDLHRRFEKSKKVIESFKQNEEALKHSIEEYKKLLQRQENKYLALKKHAEDKLLKASQDAEAQRQEFESSITRLQAALRLAELQTKGLEAQLEQKARENVELTKICDELLSKYGGLT